MKLIVASLLSVAFVATVCLAATGPTPRIAVDLPRRETSEYTKLSSAMLELDKLLVEANTPFNTNEDMQISAAESIVKKMRFPSNYLNKSLKKAAKLFASLKDVADKCDQEAFKVLAGNWLAISESSSEKRRIQMAFRYFAQRHAEKCRPQHLQRFAERVEEVSQEDFDKLALVFDSLDSRDFYRGPIYNRRFPYTANDHENYKLTMNTPYFTGESSRPARLVIAAKLLKYIERVPKWRSFLEMDDITDGDYRRALKHVFDEYLFEPCTRFSNQLNDILAPALLDSVKYKDEPNFDQHSYLHADERFYDAITFNRYCTALIEERDKLYDQFMEAWSVAKRYQYL